jgi:myo-inositol-hexaphosphate 3-phosphohydrolase
MEKANKLKNIRQSQLNNVNLRDYFLLGSRQITFKMLVKTIKYFFKFYDERNYKNSSIARWKNHHN